jgi:hypothetical protein
MTTASDLLQRHFETLVADPRTDRRRPRMGAGLRRLPRPPGPGERRFHELAPLLHQVVRFDYQAPFLHDAASSAPRAAPAPPERRYPRGASRLFANSSRSALSHACTGFELDAVLAHPGTCSSAQVKPYVAEDGERLVEVADLFFPDGTVTRRVPF